MGGWFGIYCPSGFLKILKLPKENKGKFKIFKNHKGDLSQKGWLQNNTVNGAMSIATNCVINQVM